MPIDYKKYPANWKTEIRPAILKREKHKCKFCKVKNYEAICRGLWGDITVYQNMDGQIFSAQNGEYLGSHYLGDLEGKVTYAKVVLTIAHLDHNIENNNYSNLAALCQRCHNRHDIGYRKQNRIKNKGQLQLILIQEK